MFLVKNMRYISKTKDLENVSLSMALILGSNPLFYLNNKNKSLMYKFY